MNRFIILCISLIFSFKGFSQTENLVKRYTFARSYFGVDVQVFPFSEKGYFLDESESVQSYDRSGFVIPSINIGATHFWGHADFFINIGTTSLPFAQDTVANSYRFGAITGLRVFPSAPKENSVRPFAGYKFTPFRFSQENLAGEAYNNTTVKSVLELGMAFQNKAWYIYLSGNMMLNPEEESSLSRDIQQTVRQPACFFSLGVNYRLETTWGGYSPAVRTLDTLLRERNTMGLFFAVGPSSAFPTANSSYITEGLVYLDDRSMPDIFPEITAGYHFSKQELVVATSFRPMQKKRSAYGFNQQIQRNSLAVESYKFLFDYHGFAPFIGASFMWDGMRLTESDYDVQITDERYSTAAPGIVFGWDIRPGKRADPWLLRTNLRYSPFSTIEKDGKSLSLQYLEFNFIQFVLYPHRIKYFRGL